MMAHFRNFSLLIFGFIFSPGILFSQVAQVAPGNLCWNTPTTLGSVNFFYTFYRPLDYHVDGYGNSYIAAYQMGATHSNGDHTWQFSLTKLDSSGTIIWQKDHNWQALYQTNDNFLSCFITSITADYNKNIYVTGFFNSKKLILDNITLTYATNANRGFIAQLDSNGVFTWVATMEGSSQYHSGTSIVFDNDRLFISNFGGGTLFLPNSGSVSIGQEGIIEMDRYGNYIRAFTYYAGLNVVLPFLFQADQSVGANHSAIPINPKIILAPSGHLFVVGRYESFLEVGSDTLSLPQTTTGELKSFCAILDTLNGWQNAFTLCYTNRDFYNDVLHRIEIVPAFTVDESDNLYYADHCEGGSYYLPNGTPLGGSLPNAGFVSKYSPGGQLLWANNNSDIHWSSLAKYSQGIYYYGSYTNNLLMLSRNTDSLQYNQNNGLENSFVAASDTAGNLLWVSPFGGANIDLPYHLRTSPCSDNFYFTGLLSSAQVPYNLNDSISTTQADRLYVCKHSPANSCFEPVCVTPTGIDEVSHEKFQMTIFPIPAYDILKISDIPPGEYALEIYDEMGQLVRSEIFLQGITGEISLGQMRGGIYLIKLSNGNSCFSRSFLKIEL